MDMECEKLEAMDETKIIMLSRYEKLLQDLEKVVVPFQSPAYIDYLQQKNIMSEVQSLTQQMHSIYSVYAEEYKDERWTTYAKRLHSVLDIVYGFCERTMPSILPAKSCTSTTTTAGIGNEENGTENTGTNS